MPHLVDVYEKRAGQLRSVDKSKWSHLLRCLDGLLDGTAPATALHSPSSRRMSPKDAKRPVNSSLQPSDVKEAVHI